MSSRASFINRSIRTSGNPSRQTFISWVGSVV